VTGGKGTPALEGAGKRLYGRALVVIAAEQYASRLVLPQNQRSHPSNWASHKDHAAKALKKLTGPHLPASLKQLERAIDRAHQDAKQVGPSPEPPDVKGQRDPGVETPGEDEPGAHETHGDPVGAE
jgi:hypothetical protein